MYGFILWNERADPDKAYNNLKGAVILALTLYVFQVSSANEMLTLRVLGLVHLRATWSEDSIAIFWYHAMDKEAHVVGFFCFVFEGPF